MATTKNQLSKVLRIRVSEEYLTRLEALRKKTNCGSISEFARGILYQEKIRLYYTDESLKPVVEQLAAIRDALNAIGRNINQITKTFHQSSPEQRVYQALRAGEEYQRIEEKVDQLLTMVSAIAKKWLQESGKEKI